MNVGQIRKDVAAAWDALEVIERAWATDDVQAITDTPEALTVLQGVVADVGALASELEGAQKALIRCAELSGVDGEAIEAATSGALAHPPLAQWAVEGVAELREAYDEMRDAVVLAEQEADIARNELEAADDLLINARNFAERIRELEEALGLAELALDEAAETTDDRAVHTLIKNTRNEVARVLASAGVAKDAA